MAAKRVDPLKAKEAKQKKIAAVGGVLLLALLGVQGPKTLKMLQGPQPVASATAPVSTTGAPAPSPAATVETPAVGTADLAAVADSDAAPVVEQGQLATFALFASKDPFVQQGAPAKAPAPAPAPEDAEAPSGDEPTPEQPEAEAGDDATGGFTTGGSGSASEGPAVAEATVVAVNGVEAEVAVEGSFPEDEPTFVLVSVAKDGKSVEIGIAGGEYADGDATMTLGLGKTITLQNTADGSRYELELRAIQGFPLPKK